MPCMEVDTIASKRFSFTSMTFITMLIFICSLKLLKIKINWTPSRIWTRIIITVFNQDPDKQTLLTIQTLVEPEEMEEFSSWDSMTSRIQWLVTEELYIINQTTETQIHNIMNSKVLRKVISSEDWKMATADQSQLSMDHALLDSTPEVSHQESGFHTNPTVNSPTHKESTKEAHAQPRSKLQASRRELWNTMLGTTRCRKCIESDHKYESCFDFWI